MKDKILKEIADQRESMQCDLLRLLDGLDNTVLDLACQIIVDRMKILETLVRAMPDEQVPSLSASA